VSSTPTTPPHQPTRLHTTTPPTHPPPQPITPPSTTHHTGPPAPHHPPPHPPPWRCPHHTPNTHPHTREPHSLPTTAPAPPPTPPHHALHTPENRAPTAFRKSTNLIRPVWLISPTCGHRSTTPDDYIAPVLPTDAHVGSALWGCGSAVCVEFVRAVFVISTVGVDLMGGFLSVLWGDVGGKEVGEGGWGWGRKGGEKKWCR